MAAFREISQDPAGVAAFLRAGWHFLGVDQKQNKEWHCRLSPVGKMLIRLTADRHRAMIPSPVLFPNTERINLKLLIPDWTCNTTSEVWLFDSPNRLFKQVDEQQRKTETKSFAVSTDHKLGFVKGKTRYMHYSFLFLLSPHLTEFQEPLYFNHSQCLRTASPIYTRTVHSLTGGGDYIAGAPSAQQKSSHHSGRRSHS